MMPSHPFARTWFRLVRGLSVPSRQVAAAALALAAAILTSFTYDQLEHYERAMHQAERDTRNVAQLLAEHAARTFERVEETLQAVGRLRADVARGIYRSQASIFVHLNTVRGGSSVFDEIGWFNDYGERVATTRLVDPPRTSIADRDFFRAHSEQVSRRVVVSLPARDGQRHIGMSLRLENLDGSFAGIAYGAVDPQQFANIYKALDLGAGQSVELLRNDGTILALAANLDAENGRSSILQDVELIRQQLSRASSGTYHRRSPRDDTLRIGSYATVGGTDGQLIINVSVPRASVLAGFYSEVRRHASHTGAALLALLVATGLLVQGLRRRERLQAELTAANAIANAARAEAEAASRAKSAFLARMSHELRTPLNAVIGFAQMLDRDGPRAPEAVQKEYCQHIISGGEYLLKLVNEVLDLAGIEAGRLALAPEDIRVDDVLTKVSESMAPLARQARVKLEIAPEAGVPDVRADPLRLRQVLINLTANAIKYNRQGGSVTLTAAAMPNGRIRFSVVDTGVGIAAEQHPQLFEAFNRAGSGYTAVEGTGLGLALSKRLVDAMDGTIGFMSMLGEGSTFWFELPSAMAPSHVVAPAGVPVSTDSSRPKLLYVEDNPVNLRLMKHVMASRPDVAMLTATRPESGLALAAAHRPDVIILDIHLPQMSGYELLRRLRAMPETRQTPILALTAVAQPDEVRRGLAAGFFRYLTKPIDVAQLMVALDDALAARQREDPVPLACD